jgi:tetratricopeptide (TPR) repeat protein
VAEGRFDDCIKLLSTERFSNWEGSSKPRDVFVSALMGRGKARFDAGQAETALADFQAALDYPENLGVGARYARTDAEVQYWVGKALMAVGRRDEAKAAWQNGAGQHTSTAKALPMISVPAGQDEYVQRCQTAAELINVAGAGGQ